jgi:hypothetical protein
MIIFALKLKYANRKVYRSYCRDDNVYRGSQIINTSTDVGYDIRAACTFSADETISIYDLKRQIHVSLKLLPSHFNISISARMNTASPDSDEFFYSLFVIISEEVWGIIKTTTPYQIPGYKILELVVEFEPISNYDQYDTANIRGSSNSALTE